MPQPTAAMLVIGDEMLSGRTRDANAHLLAGRLTAHGLRLVEIRVIPDDAETITGAVRALSARVDHLFTSGGIGPTHDDITADAVAAAFDTPIGIRDDAREILAKHYGSGELNEARLRMARIPDGAVLIDNPLSRAPGFTLANVHVMAGVPSIFQVMLDGLLPRLAGGTRMLSHSFHMAIAEGDLAGPLRLLAEEVRHVSIGCYPAFRSSGPSATVILRSEDPAGLAAAADRARQIFRDLNSDIDETPPESDQTS